jgi:phage replication O-like protein O
MATSTQFHGFQFPTTTPVLDEVFDVLLPKLSGAELKVLLYICRRTFGFKKQWDTISLNQIATGITTRDGRVLDRGTGLSKRHVQRALKQLEEKQIIRVNRLRDATGLNYINTYSLHFQHPLPDQAKPDHRKGKPEAVKRRAETGQSPRVGTPESPGVGTAGANGRDMTVPRVETPRPTTTNSKQETEVQETRRDRPDKIKPTEEPERESDVQTSKPTEQERQTDFQPTWNKTLQILKEQVPAPTFTTWLKETMLVGMKQRTAFVLVGSLLAKAWLERRLYAGICRALRDVLNQDVEVQFVTA